MADQGLGLSLGRFRTYLLILARAQVDPGLRARIDPSDIVQQTMLKAHKNRGQFRGATEAEFKGWLRVILARELGVALRGLGREHALTSLRAGLDHSSARMENFLADGLPGPEDRLVRAERLLRLVAALDSLPDDQRTAFELRHLRGLPVAEVAAGMGRTTASVAGLLRRAGDTLRALMGEPE